MTQLVTMMQVQSMRIKHLLLAREAAYYLMILMQMQMTAQVSQFLQFLEVQLVKL